MIAVALFLCFIFSDNCMNTLIWSGRHVFLLPKSTMPECLPSVLKLPQESDILDLCTAVSRSQHCQPSHISSILPALHHILIIIITRIFCLSSPSFSPLFQIYKVLRSAPSTSASGHFSFSAPSAMTTPAQAIMASNINRTSFMHLLLDYSCHQLAPSCLLITLTQLFSWSQQPSTAHELRRSRYHREGVPLATSIHRQSHHYCALPSSEMSTHSRFGSTSTEHFFFLLPLPNYHRRAFSTSE